MSVSDPLIKDIKGCTLKFLQELKENPQIPESSPVLLQFCQLLERIFYAGLRSGCSTLGFVKCADPWSWLEELGDKKHHLVTFAYRSSVDAVKQFRNVQTNVGKFRLLIRHCLVNKCLHVPIQFLVNTCEVKNVLYNENSILGDEILVQILLSVFLQFSAVNFKLVLRNSSFLDLTWRIPESVQLELVPCDNLGLSISFAGDKAVIVGIQSNSVISETGKVQIGDVLDNLNGIHICHATKGRLQSILRLTKGKPVNVSIVKAVYADSRDVYLPIISLLKQVQVDPDVLKSRIHELAAEGAAGDTGKNAKCSNGFKAKYMGYVDLGSRGDVKAIDKAAKTLLSPHNDYNIRHPVRKSKDVFFEVGELGVKIIDTTSTEELLKHSFMEISSCGSVSFLNNHFAYIAGNQYCNLATKFTCYVFSTNHFDTTYTILQSIGQGFQRTHFAV